MSTPVFDRLVASLSLEERKDMLDKLSNDSPESSNVATISLAPQKRGTVNDAYESLGFWQKVWFKIVAYIDRRAKEDVFHQHLLMSLRKDIDKNFSQYVNFSLGRYKKEFCLTLLDMSNSLQVFKQPLEDILGVARREYYAFLVGIVEPSVQKRLLEISRPEFVLQQSKDDEELTSNQIRSTIEESLELTLQQISKDSREKLYFYAKQIAHLERLVTFNYEKVIASYSTDHTCTMRLITKQMKKLNSILSSFNSLPNQELLQSIFLFSYSLRKIPHHNILEELTKDMLAVQRAMNLVRQFRAIPLRDILAVESDNYFYAPIELTGGEDWYILYRKFWRNKAQRLFQEFVVNKKAAEIDAAICQYYQLDLYPQLRGYASREWSDEIFVPVYEGSIGLVYFFFTKLYLTQCDYVVQKINDEGKFYKKENARELADAMSAVPLLIKEIRSFERAMSPSGGHFYLRLQEYVNQEKSAGLAGVHALIEKHVSLILTRSVEVLFILSSVLGGVIERTIGGRYDSITNLSSLDLNKNHIEQAKNLLQNTYQFLVDKKDLEERIYHLMTENKEEVERASTKLLEESEE